jgi:hypothetical protein
MKWLIIKMAYSIIKPWLQEKVADTESKVDDEAIKVADMFFGEYLNKK